MLFQHGGFDLEEPELWPSRHAGVPHVAGVPLPLVAKAARSLRSFVWRTMRRDVRTAFDHELWLCFFAGIVRQRWIDRLTPPPAPAENSGAYSALG